MVRYPVLGGAVQARSPGLESAWFQKVNLRERKSCLQFEPGFLSLHPYTMILLLFVQHVYHKLPKVITRCLPESGLVIMGGLVAGAIITSAGDESFHDDIRFDSETVRVI